MKAFKKFFALLLALLMTVSLLATTAMADDGESGNSNEPPAATLPNTNNYSITIDNAVKDHTYRAYQIFKGTLDTKGILSDVDWGTGLKDDDEDKISALITALKDQNLITKYPEFKTPSGTNSFGNVPDYVRDANGNYNSAATAQAVVEVMAGGWVYYEAEIMSFADLLVPHLTSTFAPSVPVVDDGGVFTGKYKISGLTPGYYLIVDYVNYNEVDDTFPGDGASDYILLLNRPDTVESKNTTIAPKVSAPTFTKTVHSSVDGTYGKFVDSEISDMSLENIKDSGGIDVDDAKLDALGTSNAVWFKLESKMPNLIKNYKQYHVVFEDILPASLKPIPGSSTGNIYLLHGAGGKTNLVDTQISVQKLDQNKDPIDDDNTTTPVCFYKVTLDLRDILPTLKAKGFNLNDTIVIKYAATLEPGATFGTADPNTNTATMRYSNDMNQTVEEHANPENYSTLDHADLKLGTLTSSASVYTYQATFTKIDSVTSAPLGGAEFRLFRNRTEKYTDDNGDVKEHLVRYYAKFDNGYISDWTTNENDAGTLRSGNDGKFVVKGLDAMSYHLEETVAPAGYDRMKQSLVFTIETTKDPSTLALLDLSMTTDGTKVVGELDKGIVTGNIRNTPGKVLPGTGGIGTTIFYIAGGVLVMGAAAAFVTKRRNEA